MGEWLLWLKDLSSGITGELEISVFQLKVLMALVTLLDVVKILALSVRLLAVNVDSYWILGNILF